MEAEMKCARPSRLAQALTNFAIFVPFAVLAMFFYWAAESALSPEPIERLTTQLISPPTVEQGGEFRLHMVNRPRRDCVVYVNRLFVGLNDPNMTRHLGRSIQRHVIGTNQVISSEVDILVPRTLPPGRYRTYANFRYYCNPADWVIPNQSDGPVTEIEVVPAPVR